MMVNDGRTILEDLHVHGGSSDFLSSLANHVDATSIEMLKKEICHVVLHEECIRCILMSRKLRELLLSILFKQGENQLRE